MLTTSDVKGHILSHDFVDVFKICQLEKYFSTFPKVVQTDRGTSFMSYYAKKGTCKNIIQLRGGSTLS